MKKFLIHQIKTTKIILAFALYYFLSPYWFVVVQPVMTKMRPYDIVIEKDGISFDVVFYKNYNCQFLSLEWFNNGYRVTDINYKEDGDKGETSRPLGWQTGNWKLTGVFSMDDVTAVATHSCKFVFQDIQTRFYP